MKGPQLGDQSRMDLGDEVVDVGHGRLQGSGLGQLLADDTCRLQHAFMMREMVRRILVLSAVLFLVLAAGPAAWADNVAAAGDLSQKVGGSRAEPDRRRGTTRT
jgi:hypothetical protein